MHILTSALLLFASLATYSSAFIVTTKITPAYWRATFSSPPMNIEGTDFFLDFYALIDEIANNPVVNVVVFDSSVEDFWIAHWDIINNPPSNLTSDNGVYWSNITKLANLPVLTVAAIRGIARGGGAEIAAAMDVRFASERALFSQPEVGIGVTPGGGGLMLLPILVGRARARALEIVIGADDIDAITAEKYGWINRAIPDGQFDDFVDKFARRVGGWDRHGIATAKSLINKYSGFPTTLVQNRFPALLKAGLQTNVTYERNEPQEALRFVGSGPFDV